MNVAQSPVWLDDMIAFFAENLPPDPKHVLQFLDHSTGRLVKMRGRCTRDEGMEEIKDCLEMLTPEFRAFILKAAGMICEAGEGLGE